MTRQAMSSKEFSTALEALDLSVAEAAALLNVDERTIKRWKYQERAVPGPVAAFLRHLRDLKKKTG